MAYLQSSEYGAYGVSDAQTFQVEAATRVINGYLKRPEGLLWSADANGMPAWMTELNPALRYTLASDIAPGSNVVITIPQATFSFQVVGEVVILDQANGSSAEACLVTAVSGNTITLQAVQFAHAHGATMDFGLTIAEEKKVLPNRLTVRTSRWPVARLLAGFGRYAPHYPRLSDPWTSLYLLTPSSNPLLPPPWMPFDTTQCDLNTITGVLWMQVPSTFAPYTDVRLHYVAGWNYPNLPAFVKQATANTVRSMIDVAMPGNIKIMKAGDAMLQRFNDSLLDTDTQALLSPLRLLGMG